MPRLFRAIVPVPDMKAADAFYSSALHLEPDPVAPSRHYFHCDGAILACVDPSEHGGRFRPNPDLIYLAVPDLEPTVERARAAGCGEVDMDAEQGGNGIATRPWGERSFYCRDPFGNPLCFVDEKTVFTGRA
jgi:predicted enzyme related to lactoylglutathione lyase